MLGFLVFGIICTLLIVAGGAIPWRRADRSPNGEGGHRRNRAEARQLQAHFEADDDFARNFQRPTQNEVLETLQMLDHLSPHWDQGDPALVERHLKNELAESFPTLRKEGCAYPQTIDEDIAALGADAKLSPQALATRLSSQRAKIARARQEFRTERAQANALHQLTSGADVQPVSLVPGSLPFRVTEEARSNPTARLVKRVGIPLAALGLAGVCWYLYAEGMGPWKPVAAVSNPSADNGSPSPGPIAANVPVASASVAPAGSPSARAPAVTTTGNDATPPPATVGVPAESSHVSGPTALAEVPSPSPQATEALLAAQVAQSQRRAVDKYPELAVPNSEMNIRFVFRYKNLLEEKSPRLQDPNWPEKLADECAKAAGGGTRGKKITQAGSRER